MQRKPTCNGFAEHHMGAEIQCAKKHLSVQKTLSSTFGTIIPILQVDWMWGVLDLSADMDWAQEISTGKKVTLESQSAFCALVSREFEKYKRTILTSF